MRYAAYASILALGAYVIFAALMATATIGREQAAWAYTAVATGIPTLALGIIWLLQERKTP